MILFSLFIFLVKIELAQSITQSICATTECPDIKINIKESSDAGAGNGIATTMTLEFIPDLTAPGLFKPLNQTGQSQGDIWVVS